jgi:hypothetical protein
MCRSGPGLSNACDDPAEPNRNFRGFKKNPQVTISRFIVFFSILHKSLDLEKPGFVQIEKMAYYVDSVCNLVNNETNKRFHLLNVIRWWL